MIRYLKWDSNFFEKKIGLIKVNSTNVKLLAQEKKRENYNLVYCFCEEGNSNIQNSLLKIGGVLVDEKVTFEKCLSSNYTQNSNVKEYEGELTDELKALAIESGFKSRFKKDEKLRNKFEELYILWIKNSLNGKVADKVFVVENAKKIIGFVTVRIQKNIGSIGLIAVNDNYRGKGLASQLISACVHYLFVRDIRTLQVVTQKSNLKACALYEKNKFVKKTIENIYHY